MLKSVGRISKGNLGFTAIELVVGVAIVSLIGIAAATGVTQVFSGSTMSNDRMTAVNNVRNAGDWISQDVRMAKTSVILDEPDVLMQMEWEDYSPPDGGPPNKYLVQYTLSDWRLYRRYVEEIPGEEPEEENRIIAENITVTSEPSFSDNQLTITLTSIVGSVEETRTFDISLRNLPQ